MIQYMKKWCIYSERSGNHIISLLADNTYQCDCIGWTRHYPRKNCKHIREVIETNPEPLNMNNWEALRGKRQKVKKTLDVFARIQRAEQEARRE